MAGCHRVLMLVMVTSYHWRLLLTRELMMLLLHGSLWRHKHGRCELLLGTCRGAFAPSRHSCSWLISHILGLIVGGTSVGKDGRHLRAVHRVCCSCSIVSTCMHVVMGSIVTGRARSVALDVVLHFILERDKLERHVH